MHKPDFKGEFHEETTELARMLIKSNILVEPSV